MELLPGADLEAWSARARGCSLHEMLDDHDPGLPRPCVRPRTRYRPPRHQADEHPAARRRRRQDHGLRDRQAGRDQPDQERDDGRDDLLHEPGADPGEAARRAQRRLLGGRDPLRAAGGQRPFAGDGADPGALQDRARGACPSRSQLARGARSPAPGHPLACAGQGPGPTVSGRRRDGGGSPSDPRGRDPGRRPRVWRRSGRGPQGAPRGPRRGRDRGAAAAGGRPAGLPRSAPGAAGRLSGSRRSGAKPQGRRKTTTRSSRRRSRPKRRAASPRRSFSPRS